MRILRSKCTFTAVALALALPVMAEPRFSGNAALAKTQAQTSPNGRFSVTAELQKAADLPLRDADQRFALNAEIAAPRALATACGPISPEIFKNGFE